MTEINRSIPLEERIDSIDEKLSYITRELDAQSRARRERSELMDDLGFVGKDLYQTAVTELEQVAPYFDTQDLTHLFKRVLRNVRTINELLDKLEGSVDFIKDASPLTADAFHELLQKLDSIDRKGYFEFLSEMAKIIDTVVCSFTADDVRALRENISPIISTVKNMTQPGMLSAANNAVNFYEQMGVPVDEDISAWALLKELNDPETRRGLAFMIRFMKSMASSRYELPASGRPSDQ